jgi:hypothetical protein
MQSSSWFSLLDMAIVGIPVFVIGTWQLISVNREIAKDKAKAAERARLAQGSPPESRSPESPGHPVREHRLDDR